MVLENVDLSRKDQEKEKENGVAENVKKNTITRSKIKKGKKFKCCKRNFKELKQLEP